MPSRAELDEAAELAEELGISRSEARMLITARKLERHHRDRREDSRKLERVVPYEGNKETR